MSLLTDEELRALQEQAHQLHEMTRHPGWPVLVDYLDATTRGVKLSVLNGNVDSLEAYKAKTGLLIGIQQVLDVPQSVQRILDGELSRRAETQ